MVARTKPQPPAGSAVRVASAARRAATRDPGRAGALRSAALALAVALLAGGAAFWATRSLLLGEQVRHLEALRDVAAGGAARTLDELRRETGGLAEDPRTVAALRELRDGFARVADEIVGRTPAKLAPHEAALAKYYDAQVLPELAAARGSAPTRESVYPSNERNVVKDAPIVLQSLYLAGSKQPEGERQKLIDARDGSTYTRAHAQHHPWLEALARRNGWESVLLVDADSSHVVYGSAKTPDTFTALRGGPYQKSALAAVVRKTSEAEQRALVRLSDVERAQAYGDRAMLFAAAPVFDGASRIGTVVAVIGASRLEEAMLPGSDAGRWARLGLGEQGEILLIGPDGRLRSTPRAFLRDPADFWRSAAPESRPLRHETSPIGLATSAPPGLADALAGATGSGSTEVDGQRVIGAWTPLQIGDGRWAVVAERPEADALAGLAPLLGVLLLTAALATAIGWTLGGRLWSQFGRRLHRSTDAVLRSLRGDRTVRLDATQKGATGELAAAVNRLLDERQSLLERVDEQSQRVTADADSLLGVVREAAGGNLASRAAVGDGALGNVSRTLNEMLDAVAGLVGTLQQTSGRVGAQANEIRAAAEQASRGVVAQVRQFDGTSAATEELLAGTARIAEQCGASVDVARRAEQAGRLGQTAVADVLAGMDGLQRDTRAATVKIKRLGERSMQISAIIGAISKMSAQTDMLALNAAIEASRAGEHGQGFTVVAEEVRKLAERASAATKEIERLIAGIQADVGEAVSGMERQGERLELQSAAASQAQHALERVCAATAEASAAIHEVVGSAEQQARCVEQIGGAIRSLAATAQGVQQSAEATRRTTTELISSFEELDTRARRFHA